MEFRPRPHTKGEGSAKDERRDAKTRHDVSSTADDGTSGEEEEIAGDDHESDDPDGEQKSAAGDDLISAIKSGDGRAVFLAHRHLHNVHLTTGPDSEEDSSSASDGMDHKVGLVAAIRGMSSKKGE
jgi:hypothetical protein